MGVSPTNLATERFWVLTITDEITHSNSINENHIETFCGLETGVDSRNRHLCETGIHSQEERRFRLQQAGKSQEETEECMVRYHNPPTVSFSKQPCRAVFWFPSNETKR